MKPGVKKTQTVFTFELHLIDPADGMTPEAATEAVYNCLDFCEMTGAVPHFYLAGRDAEAHPGFWELLALLRESGAVFSVLAEPEQSAFAESMAERRENDNARLQIQGNGDVYHRLYRIGNVWEDRLADIWAVRQSGNGGEL